MTHSGSAWAVGWLLDLASSLSLPLSSFLLSLSATLLVLSLSSLSPFSYPLLSPLIWQIVASVKAAAILKHVHIIDVLLVLEIVDHVLDAVYRRDPRVWDVYTPLCVVIPSSGNITQRIVFKVHVMESFRHIAPA